MRTRLVLAILLLVALVTQACGTGRPALLFEPAELPAGMVGLPYAATVTVIQNETPVGDIYLSSGQLPAGLLLEFVRGAANATAQITGTPTVSGSFPVTIAAWCLGTNVSGQTGEKTYTIVIS
jgi:hypothetical protein